MRRGRSGGQCLNNWQSSRLLRLSNQPLPESNWLGNWSREIFCFFSVGFTDVDGEQMSKYLHTVGWSQAFGRSAVRFYSTLSFCFPARHCTEIQTWQTPLPELFPLKNGVNQTVTLFRQKNDATDIIKHHRAEIQQSSWPENTNSRPCTGKTFGSHHKCSCLTRAKKTVAAGNFINTDIFLSHLTGSCGCCSETHKASILCNKACLPHSPKLVLYWAFYSEALFWTSSQYLHLFNIFHLYNLFNISTHTSCL